jgi:adenine deaminase
METIIISGTIVDVVKRRIFPGSIEIRNGSIDRIIEKPVSVQQFLLPGLIDAHIHVESSMLIPSQFAQLAVIHGTIGTVSDPHEIANVLGVPGVRFMISNGKKVPFKFNFGAPSCVPATSFETAGAVIGMKELEELLSMHEIRYMSEMMNFPGVLSQNPEVMAKLTLAKRMGKPIDGHAPGLMGDDVQQYINAGISTDHECFSREEALEKITSGMKVMIREGSAAKNFEVLYPLIDQYSDMVMLCSDDKHPDDLEAGHINMMVKRALDKGSDLFNVLCSCTLNPRNHYHLNTGLLQQGDPADLIVVNNLTDFDILETWIDGIKVAEKGIALFPAVSEIPFNNFNIKKITQEELNVKASGNRIKVIHALDGQLITEMQVVPAKIDTDHVVSDPQRDILKLVVKNRYQDKPASIGFISGFGLKKGGIASCVAHDSHNIISVGTNDRDICEAINLIIHNKGGISVVDGNETIVLPLPFAGIMSGDAGKKVAELYSRIDKKAKMLGSTLTAPFMTLSFMALLVIPSLKLSDIGLFNGSTFSFTHLFET